MTIKIFLLILFSTLLISCTSTSVNNKKITTHLTCIKNGKTKEATITSSQHLSSDEMKREIKNLEEYFGYENNSCK